MLTRFTNLAKVAPTFQLCATQSFKFSNSKEDADNKETKKSDKDTETETKKDDKKKVKTARGSKKFKKVALVLSGCGVYDGSEVTEAVSFMISFGSRKIDFQCYAPNQDQSEVIDHTTGKKMKEERNVLVESARIARGNVKPLNELKADDYDAVFFPGGFGAAKNLSDFAGKGDKVTVDKEAERVLQEFHSSQKPIGLTCIAPVLAAKVLGGDAENKLTLTVGDKGDKDKWPYGDTVDAVEKLGAQHKAKAVTKTLVDARNLVLTTPAFMFNTQNFHDVYQGIDNLVGSTADLVEKIDKDTKEKSRVKKEKRKTKREEKKAKKAEKDSENTKKEDKSTSTD